MTNALRVAADFLARLAARSAGAGGDRRPRRLHPPLEISGGVGEVKIRFLLRDFETAPLAGHAQLLRQAAEADAAEFPGRRNRRGHHAAVSEHGRWTCPRAAGGGLRRKGPRAGWGGPAEKTIVRGGTDGSRLTELGLPTPNLSCRQPHPIRPWNGPAWMKWSSRSSGSSRWRRCGAKTEVEVGCVKRTVS